MSKVKDKSKILLIDVLTRLNQEESAPDIARAYGWNRQRLDYHIKKLKKEGLINVVARSSMNIYELSEQGKTFLNGHLTGFEGLVLHNVEYSYPILSDTDNFTYDKQWKWGKLLIRAKKLSGCSIKVTGRTLVISVEHIPGVDSFKLADEAKKIADRTVEWLKSQGFDLGQGTQTRKPHFGIVGPLAKKIAEQVQISADSYHINASQGGEVEYFTPETADAYMRMPEKLAGLEDHLVKQTLIMDKFSEQLERHLSAIQGIETTQAQLRDTITELMNAVREMKK